MTFAGEIADHYARYRRGFGPAALAFVRERLRAGPDALVVDLGCGTGQLAVPLSAHVRHVLGVDPEPDMLRHAYAAAGRAGATGATSWMLGSDADVPGLAGLLGRSAVQAVTISNAVHFMDTGRLFAGLTDVLAPGGRVAVIANGTPVWLQDPAWSRALRRFLGERYGTDASGSRCTDAAVLARCREDMAAAGLATEQHRLDLRAAVTPEWLAGNLVSAMPPEWLPADMREFADAVATAVRSAQPAGGLVEDVPVTVLAGVRA
ncbi:hypothetical protein BJF78_18770 [Pseudonocardia sp. CNS-139]|nr:hypothetical protein BJF78_18770 [Pseudonocardia sp. CNS-139]